MICALPLLMLGGVTLTANAAANATLNKTAIVDEAMPGLISGKVRDVNGEPIIGASIKQYSVNNYVIV